MSILELKRPRPEVEIPVAEVPRGVVGVMSRVAVHTEIEMDNTGLLEEHVASVTTPIDLEEKYQRNPNISEEDIWAAKRNAEVLLPGARVAVRTSLQSLTEILSEGRFKTFRQTGISRGNGGLADSSSPYAEARDRREVPLKMSEDDPDIIYGFLDYEGDDETRTRHFTYGSVKAVMKPQVSSRTTFTTGDSLALIHEPFLNLQDAVVVDQVEEIHRQKTGGVRSGSSPQNKAMEAQIQGGVKLEDIERLVISLDSRLNPIYEKSEKDEVHVVNTSSTQERLESLINTIQEGLPSAPLTLRLDSSGLVYSKAVIELAKKYPHVTFAMVVPAPQRFVRSKISNQKRNHEDPEVRAVAVEVQSSLDKEYVKGHVRLEGLKNKMDERAQEMGEEGLPSNVTFGLYDEYAN